MIPLTERVIARFWPRVNKTETCWLWTGATLHFGYGSVSIGNRTYRAHRVSWQIANGPIGQGLDVCHRCDVPACVRPDHLFLGSHIDNNRDRDRKGRQVTPRGERHGSVRLTREIVGAIRSSPPSNVAWARLLGVSRSTVRRARLGICWADIPATRLIESPTEGETV